MSSNFDYSHLAAFLSYHIHLKYNHSVYKYSC